MADNSSLGGKPFHEISGEAAGPNKDDLRVKLNKLWIEDTKVTATGAELNTLSGITSTTTELNHLDNADRLKKTIKVALAASDAAAGVFSWQNTEEAADIIVTDVIIDLTTASSGACTVNVGQASSAAASDNLIDGLDVNAAAGVFDSVTEAGTNGKTAVKVADDEYVTASVATGASAGLAGNAYITYIVA